MKIYIVQGTTGEYSDRTDWIVCAFKDKKAADQRARKAMQRGKEIEKEKEALRSQGEEYWEFKEDGKNEFDAKFMMDYTGTEYHVEETELL